MKKTIFPLALVLAWTSLADPADPQVSQPTVNYAPGSTRVSVSYALDEDAVVTMDVLTNGVSIGGQNIGKVTGDCFKLVAAGSRSFVWHARQSWPDHKIDEKIVTVKVTAWSKTHPPKFMVIDLTDGAVSYYQEKDFLPGGIASDVYKTTKLLMRKIPAGGVAWTMGAPGSEPGKNALKDYLGYWADDFHAVTLKKDFYLGVYEMTQGQMETLAGKAVGFHFKNEACHAMRPNDYTCLSDALKYIKKISDRSGVAGLGLPSDIQWEFACRAGSATGLYTGKDLPYKDASAKTTYDADANLDQIARYGYDGGLTDASGNELTVDYNWTTEHGTAAVGSYAPNGFDLYDMLGNVWELTRTAWNANGGLADPDDESQTIEGDSLVIRGGSWREKAGFCRSATRTNWSTGDWPSWRSDQVGFRVYCPAVAEK